MLPREFAYGRRDHVSCQDYLPLAVKQRFSLSTGITGGDVSPI